MMIMYNVCVWGGGLCVNLGGQVSGSTEPGWGLSPLLLRDYTHAYNRIEQYNLQYTLVLGITG